MSGKANVQRPAHCMQIPGRWLRWQARAQAGAAYQRSGLSRFDGYMGRLYGKAGIPRCTSSVGPERPCSGRRTLAFDADEDRPAEKEGQSPVKIPAVWSAQVAECGIGGLEEVLRVGNRK